MASAASAASPRFGVDELQHLKQQAGGNLPRVDYRRKEWVAPVLHASDPAYPLPVMLDQKNAKEDVLIIADALSNMLSGGSGFGVKAAGAGLGGMYLGMKSENWLTKLLKNAGSKFDEWQRSKTVRAYLEKGTNFENTTWQFAVSVTPDNYADRLKAIETGFAAAVRNAQNGSKATEVAARLERLDLAKETALQGIELRLMNQGYVVVRRFPSDELSTALIKLSPDEIADAARKNQLLNDGALASLSKFERDEVMSFNMAPTDYFLAKRGDASAAIRLEHAYRPLQFMNASNIDDRAMEVATKQAQVSYRRKQTSGLLENLKAEQARIRNNPTDLNTQTKLARLETQIAKTTKTLQQQDETLAALKYAKDTIKDYRKLFDN